MNLHAQVHTPKRHIHYRRPKHWKLTISLMFQLTAVRRRRRCPFAGSTFAINSRIDFFGSILKWSAALCVTNSDWQQIWLNQMSRAREEAKKRKCDDKMKCALVGLICQLLKAISKTAQVTHENCWACFFSVSLSSGTVFCCCCSLNERTKLVILSCRWSLFVSLFFLAKFLSLFERDFLFLDANVVVCLNLHSAHRIGSWLALNSISIRFGLSVSITLFFSSIFHLFFTLIWFFCNRIQNEENNNNIHIYIERDNKNKLKNWKIIFRVQWLALHWKPITGYTSIHSVACALSISLSLRLSLLHALATRMHASSLTLCAAPLARHKHSTPKQSRDCVPAAQTNSRWSEREILERQNTLTHQHTHRHTHMQAYICLVFSGVLYCARLVHCMRHFFLGLCVRWCVCVCVCHTNKSKFKCFSLKYTHTHRPIGRAIEREIPSETAIEWVAMLATTTATHTHTGTLATISERSIRSPLRENESFCGAAAIGCASVRACVYDMYQCRVLVRATPTMKTYKQNRARSQHTYRTGGPWYVSLSLSRVRLVRVIIPRQTSAYDVPYGRSDTCALCALFFYSLLRLLLLSSSSPLHRATDAAANDIRLDLAVWDLCFSRRWNKFTHSSMPLWMQRSMIFIWNLWFHRNRPNFSLQRCCCFNCCSARSKHSIRGTKSITSRCIHTPLMQTQTFRRTMARIQTSRYRHSPCPLQRKTTESWLF